jgi:DNA modification methylase/superfamily II DNA or RNA helicase
VSSYEAFLKGKTLTAEACGIEVEDKAIHQMLFPFQRDLTRYALRKGRSAVFADTGLGKTFIQCEWARLTGGRALIVAPLSVARQTVREAAKLGTEVRYVRHQSEVKTPLSITNYEMLDEFDPDKFDAVALDESSILKAMDGKTRNKLTDMFAGTPLKLCCTATPAPNDISEIANHAEFLGIISRAEMLAMFFVHDDEGWRLKGHAELPFYRWLASWGISIRKPSDLGYSDEGYELPPLTIMPHFVETECTPDDALFYTGLKGIQDRSSVRKKTTAERVAYTADLVGQSADQCIVWHGLNEEGYELVKAIPGSVLVEGSQSPEEKASALEAFQDGAFRVLVTKPKIAGFGMNFQNAHTMAFCGMNDSWEAYYQCIRRCWRFGQLRPVQVHAVLSEIEQDIWENVMRKDAEAQNMRENLIEHVKEFEKAEIGGTGVDWSYETDTIKTDDYTLMLGDSVERMAEIADESVDLSVFSPPFSSLYTYTPTERDIGNCRTEEEFFRHFGFIIDNLLRVTKPGRNCAVHVAQIPAMLARDGYIGLKDFRGKTIEAFESHGWIFHGDITIDKDPQAQAIRTHSKALLFTQLKKDSSWLRPALADYILVFRKPGENAVPIHPDLTNNEWIEWARPIWYGIKETDTLNYTEARESADERHICPLQLGTIERCIRLWSNPGETVCSPFAGIASEGHVSIKQGRKFIGIELKRNYFNVGARNLKAASENVHTADLFAVNE